MRTYLQNQTRKLVGQVGPICNRISLTHHDRRQAAVFDTSIGTHNLGDFIIMKYCNLAIRELLGNTPTIHISTHRTPTSEEESFVKASGLKLICGTNLLTSHIEEWWNWILPDGFRGKLPYRGSVLLGVGWGQYQDECSEYSKMIYRWILHPDMLHSVRDHYTEEKLRHIGIQNVINTGCPTMWRLTPEFCAEIPARKASSVVTTITDYRRDPQSDSEMLAILARQYERVYLWLQGEHDLDYLNELKCPAKVELIPRDLAAYEACLQNPDLDYVGTRLHAGIFALNHHRRTIVIAVDNRAIEIARDTALPLVLRENIGGELEDRICRTWNTDIHIPLDNIQRFKRQFISGTRS